MFNDLPLLWGYLPQFLTGVALTAEICVIAIALGMMLGFFVALLRRVPFRPLRWLVGAYVEVLRGTPLLIQLFILYYGGPDLGLTLDAVPAGIIGLMVYTSAQFSEIVRATFAAVPPGQIEAARLLGLSRAQAFWHVQIRQVAMLMIPPGANQAISILKDSSVLSIITVPEITFQTTRMVNETFSVTIPYLFLALAYWAMVIILGVGAGRMEKAVSQ
jgi:polar amino acid transport system permease protein